MPVTATELRRLVFEELEALGFAFDERGNLTPPAEGKETARRLHQPSRQIKLAQGEKWIKTKLPRYSRFFANGEDINPVRIQPLLLQVTEEWQNDLFRLARYYWSIPYSFGFGRRLRYLMLDESNDKLIGIFGLQSPPIGFPARDRLFNYPEQKKSELVNQTMDIFTLGSLPPYNRLLGGKLVAFAAVSNEIRNDYQKTYSNRKTEMENRLLPSHLVALTTTSAFGRSSIYNRLKYKETPIAESLGYTEGYGNFHLQRLYPLFKEFLRTEEIETHGGYGTGPKRSWQIMRRALDRIGISGDILKHGIKREAFLFRLIGNLEDYMSGEVEIPTYHNFPFEDLAAYWKDRWLMPRSERVDGWHKWLKEDIEASLLLSDNKALS